MNETYLQPMEKEILLEIGNSSVSAATQSLSSFVSGAINAQPPEVNVLGMEDLSGMTEKGLFVQVVFREGVVGQQFLFFPAASAALLGALLMGEEPSAEPPEKLGEMEESALSEVVGMFMGVYTTTLSGFIGTTVGIDPPQSEYISPGQKDFTAAGLGEQEQWVAIQFTLDFEPDYQAIFYQYIPYSFMKEIVAPLMPEQTEVEAPPETIEVPGAERAALIDESELTETEEMLTEMQKDALSEIGNISLGASATALSELLNRRVQITTPEVTLTTMKDVLANYPVPCLVVTVNYIKGLAGNNVLILQNEDALSIVGVMMGMEPPEKPPELGEMELSGISEAMNQMMGASATSMSEFFGRLIDISPPILEAKDLNNESLDISDLDDDSPVIKIAFHMEVEGLLDSNLLQLIPLPFAQEMASSLLASMGFPEPGDTDGIMGDFATLPDDAAEESISAGFNFADADNKEEEGIFSDLDIFTGAASSEPAVAPPQSAAPSTVFTDQNYSRIDMIRDIPINIYALLGKTRLPLKKVFSLLPGEIIALERYLGEAVDIYANDRLVAKGEVVVVNGQFGIKIIEMFHSQ